jgi:ubiquinone/menaquinone biosynthesis C-methylase UbiE
MLNVRRSHLLGMINYPDHKGFLIADIGCSIGYLTKPMSLRAETVGLDIDKIAIRYAKACCRKAEFICCDVYHLPLRNSSVNLVVCASVFEHLEKLCEAIKEVKLVLKQDAKLAVGYPIETKLLESVVKAFWKSESHIWDQSNIAARENHVKNPHTHKQSFSEIRKMLGKDFSILRKRKMPINCFPDFLSLYESIILVRNERAK